MQVFNAIFRSKLMYGLEAVVMNQRTTERLDVFQLTCLMNILQVPTTYVNNYYSNDLVMTLINSKLQQEEQKPITGLIEYHKKSRVALLTKFIVEGSSEAGTCVTLYPEDLRPVDWGTKRVGQPRENMYKITLEDFWTATKKHIAEVKYASVLDHKDPRHVRALREYAKSIYKAKSESVGQFAGAVKTTQPPPRGRPKNNVDRPSGLSRLRTPPNSILPCTASYLLEGCNDEIQESSRLRIPPTTAEE